MTEKELQLRDKSTLSQSGESTKDGTYFAPAVDIYETEEEVMVIVDMPGVSPDDLELSLEDCVLNIHGTNSLEDQPGRIILEEYENGHYLRRFNVAENIDQDKIKAVLNDGVLTVTLPKAVPAQPKKINVKVG